MNILALDSSTQVVSVAVMAPLNGQPNISFQESVHHDRFDSSFLFNGIEKAINTSGQPDAIVVGLGPGSYNGIRAGISACRGIATAREIPLFAFPSPLAIAGPPSGFWVIGDARGGHFWIACVKDGAFKEEPFLMPSHLARPHLDTRPDYPILSSARLDGIPSIHIATPVAALLAKLTEKGEPFIGTPEPLYLKPPHITISRAIFTKS